MTQRIAKRDAADVSDLKRVQNVGEHWIYQDTVLVTGYNTNFSFNDGWFGTYANIGAANNIPFFNVRNRNHGIAYNNQDTRDQLNFALRIFTIGVQFFASSTAEYRNTAGVPTGPQNTEQHIWECELPKHAAVSLRTNQDTRLRIPAIMVPSGTGPVGGGVAQGDMESYTTIYPNVSKHAFSQGIPHLTNKWAFRKPIEVPRRVNLSVVIEFSEYARTLLQGMTGPTFQPFRDVAADDSYYFNPGMAGIRITLSGQRLVQQRGQYHV